MIRPSCKAGKWHLLPLSAWMALPTGDPARACWLPMIVKITGAISGGCLEGDALEKALFAMATGENKLITYDSTGEDDIQFGLHLGCNGVVYILFEPIKKEDPNNPVELLRLISNAGEGPCL